MSLDQLWEIREAVRRKKPLVHNITNNVVTNFTANILLAAGAAPIMSEAKEETAELLAIVDVLVLNIGTLHPRQVENFLAAGRAANKLGKPVVLDPVGVGATSYRNQTAAQIIEEVKLSLIRGNYGEVSFLAGITGGTKGVDSLSAEIDTQGLKELAIRTGALIAATGEVDYVAAAEAIKTNSTGHVLLQSVTGTGCALTSLCGAFLAVAPDPDMGVLAALAFYGAAAQKAAVESLSPGSFGVAFIDALYSLTQAEFIQLAGGRVSGL